MFCSADCRTEFYKYSDFSSEYFDKIAVIVRKMEAALGGRKKLEKTIREGCDVSFFDLDFNSTSKAEQELNTYKNFLSLKLPRLATFMQHLPLSRYDSKFKKIMIRVYSVLGVSLLPYRHYMEDCTKFNALMNDIWLQHLHFIYDGMSFSSFGALLNSSCVPNVNMINIGTKMAFYLSRPVKAGEQIFTAYA
jgi:hypothetical protein